MIPNLNGLYPNLSRVCEIALCGNHSINLINSPNGDFELSKADYDFIMEYFKLKNSDNAEINIELLKPDPSSLVDAFTRKYESLNDVVDRVENFKKQNSGPADFNYTIPPAGISLLKMAAGRLDLGIVRLSNILRVAKTISLMSGEKKFTVEAIAEAIQYQNI